MPEHEYTPSDADERIAHAYAEVVYHGSEGMVSREEGLAEFYAWLAAHDAKAKRDAWQEGHDAGYENAPWDRYSEPDPEPLTNPYAPEETP